MYSSGVGETDDILQNATLRLCRALETVKPPSVRDFFRLAAALIRPADELASTWAGSGDEMPAPDAEVADTTYDPGHLAEWTGFHAQVEALPEEEREVFDLLFYQGLPQAEAAAVLGVSERTIKRRWQAARLALHEALGGRLPGV